MSDLQQQAINIIQQNDQGSFTIPTDTLYPFQWNWDSAFAALGFACFDPERAWQEIETLFEGQWSDGMVPHIVFRQPDESYFPGPDVWGTNTTPASSGHSQPPVAASVVYDLTQQTNNHARASLLFPKLLRYHEWFHLMRDPNDTGLVAAIHPWETGRDNCPDWDSGMDQVVVPKNLPKYVRRDTSHLGADQRPSTEQYDRFLSIVKYARDHHWDHKHLYHHGPFLMADPGIQFILLRADRDLLALANILGLTEYNAKIQQWINQSVNGCDHLWNKTISGFTAKDLRSEAYSQAITNASMLCFYADAGNQTQQRAMLDHAESILASVKYSFPSWDPRDKYFDSRRYWRGPVWAIMNFMIARGMKDLGESSMATRINNDTIALIETAGFNEYFDPQSGEGLGGRQFTWTAAIYLALTSHR